MRLFFSHGRLQVATIALVVCLACQSSNRVAPIPAWDQEVSAAETLIQLDWQQDLGPVPTQYGVEHGWVDQDKDLFVQRYRQLAPKVIRVQITQAAFEPVNDNPEPDFSEINFNQTFTQDDVFGKTITYQDMFSTLGEEFPSLNFHINIWLAATWNASDSDGYLGLGGAFPPLNDAEHQEFIRALAEWLVETCQIAPERLSFSFINEPNLPAFFTGTGDDLVEMSVITRQGLDQVSSKISMSGLDEVHGVTWTTAFAGVENPGCCDFWTFHAYEKGVETLWDSLSSRIQSLSTFGPVWVTEFADTNNGSPDAKMDFSTKEAALGFARLGGRLWASGVEGVIHFRLADTYLTSLDGWAGHGLFSDWRGIKSDGKPYALYPSYWVFANLFNHLGQGEVVASTFSNGLEGVAVRQTTPSPRLFLWAVNPGSTAVTAQVLLQDFPAEKAQIEVIDALTDIQAQRSFSLVGSSLEWEIELPAESVTLLRVSSSTVSPENMFVFLPLALQNIP